MKVLTNNQYYSQIANVIREQNGTNNTYKPAQMVSALKDLFYEEVERVPPISFNGIGENLLDYRIDGASGGVGDRTKNLFDGTFLHRSVIGATVGPDDVNRRAIAIDISNYNNGEKITFSRDTGVGNMFQMYQISSIQTGGRLNNENVINGDSNTLLATKTITNVNEYPYLMIFLNGATKPIEDEELIASKIMINVGNTALPYEPYGYKVPVVVSGNNLAKWDTHLLPQTNGIVLNDTNSISSIIDVTNINNIYIFGDRTKLNSNVYRIGKSNEPISLNSQTTRITYVGGVLDTSDCNYVIVSCSIYNTETTFDDIKNSFMIVEGTTSPDNFEPYIEPTTTNIYLDEPIGANESISLSDTNVNIPTIRGTNVLTVDTTVQPSNVYVKSRHESSHEAQIRQLYESVNAELTQYKAQYGELGGE